MKKAALLLVFAIILFGCEENTTDTDDEGQATKVSIEDIKDHPSYAYFTSEYNSYEPDADILDSIRSASKDSDVYYLYLEPGCNCNAQTKHFPKIIKILDLLEVDHESRIEMYNMNKIYDTYPHDDIISLNDIPEYYVQSDELINLNSYLSKVSEDSLSFEQAFLNALKKIEIEE